MLLQFTSDVSSLRVKWHMQIWSERLYRLVNEYVTKKLQMTSALDELNPHVKISMMGHDINILMAVCFENEDFAAILLFW